ncbi:MAG: nucleotidyl transferase AbiEii/AbiGii toxin family protein [Phycisphaerae bacterium]|jgi:predicted nucleotidyltransferase component of viral defense system
MKDQPRRYATAAAFRVALEARLKTISASEGTDLQRLRRQVSFDRLLARLFSERHAPWLLKGGYAMELRLSKARTTKDVDISLPANAVAEFGREVLKRLQGSARTDLGDFFAFVIGDPQMDLKAAPQGGTRYPVTAFLAGRVFTKFHLDIGVGDPVVLPTELIAGRDWLGFAGISAPSFMAISKEQQFAEKLHAYTLPRPDSRNSRVKDLVDMVLLLQMGTMDAVILKRAIHTTFDLRATHPVPKVLLEPPDSWILPFTALMKECRLEMTLKDALKLINQTPVS